MTWMKEELIHDLEKILKAGSDTHIRRALQRYLRALRAEILEKKPE